MTPTKNQYYHAQAARLDLRRKWQSMAIWPIIFRFGDRLRMECEYQHGPFRVDLFIHGLDLAVEIDEPFHDKQVEADTARQEQIAAGLGCAFVRIRVNHPEGKSVFTQVEELSGLIARRLEQENPAPWVLEQKPPRFTLSRTGGWSESHRRQLEEANIPAKVEEMMRDLVALGLEVTEDMGPVSASNGELGFTIRMPGVDFVVSIRPNTSCKLLALRHDPAIVRRLGLTLEGPVRVRGHDYWKILEVPGRFPIETVVARLAELKRRIDDGNAI